MDSEARTPERSEIESLLPHRAPFLFVDRILERGADSIVTEWDVRPDLDCFRGHYPGEPILPGVLTSEFCLQSGALLLYAAHPEECEGAGVPLATAIRSARFRGMVRPGETLRAEVRLEESLGPARYLSARVRSGERSVARVAFTLAFAPRPA